MKRRTIETICNVISVIAGLVLVGSICCLDSDSIMPIITLGISGAWLTIQAYRKGAFTW